ncbi:hypothetical protein [Bradyrhizobium sp. WD16]|uniref:portal protein n=1 Tax=Bradyrhizobium sp. WD16 TaxID=1521768 RepID=UPI0020A3C47C|nr:hypothetical protein [Bradyrhizobium sp. WD16]UTD28227.1 hypothetical protein DB459_16330 [Bradyrhizobium sp. WD16]
MITDREDAGDRREEGEAPDAEALFARLKGWFQQDFDRLTDWRKDAREDFAFTAGDQLTEEDKARLREMNRPIIVMNRIEPVIDSVAGSEVANRQEVQFIPRTQGDVAVNEVLTSAAKWFRDQCDAEDEESDAFRDTVICGMGWTETRLDYEDDPDGAPVVERVDPLEMVWDSSAKKRNLVDMRRVFHIRRDIPIEEARALCPGDEFEDADYNATWVDDAPDGRDQHHNDGRFYNKGDQGDGQERAEKTVTMVRAQWWERSPAYLVIDPTDPNGQNILTLDKDDFEQLQAKAEAVGGRLRFTRSTRKAFKQAFLGRIMLEIGEAPCKDHFSFKCITGKRDRNKNVWYGLVRGMKDPQRWANRWMAQTMHIINTSAKGGIAAERGAFFENDADGEASWAKQDAVTYLKQGAVSGQSPKFIAKPVSQFPQSSFELMQFAISSIRDTSGVNVELLGLASNSGQAASLDRQRKQSAMTILQSLFDSLRRYRKEQGRLLLYLIENYLSDGRLIKIVGEEGARYVPLIRQGGLNTYDVIVDEAPSSPNQKEATWSLLQQLLPVIGKMLPPATWLALLKYSPLPSSAQDDIRKSLEQQQGQPDPAQQQRDAELQMTQAKGQAEIANHQALTKAKIDGMHAEAQAKQQIEMRKAAAASLSQFGAPQIGPDGQPIQPQGGDPGAVLIAFLQQFEQGMRDIASAMAAPKQIIRDQNGEPIGVAPMPPGNATVQ